MLGSTKAFTTEDIASGVTASIESVLKQVKLPSTSIQSVMIGTTQFTNAFVERRRLAPVAVIRLGLPASASLPPLTGWPRALVEAIGSNVFQLHGGSEIHGGDISALDEAGLRTALRQIQRRGITSIAISSIFSPVNPAMEKRAKAIVEEVYPAASVTLASDIGRVGLIERENAAVMNASLSELSRQVVGAFRASLSDLDMQCPFFISQNDGTLMSADYVERYPVLTFASGPTNSMRGAAYLSGEEDAVVIDIGGTTSDIGVLQKGFPRESSVPVDIGGVRTNFRMPDVLALGLGGGSIVHTDGELRIGPDSVGFRLSRDALVFGGRVLTTTDIAVAAGHATIGDVSRVRGKIPQALIDAVTTKVHEMLEAGIDRVKSNSKDVTAILVGGGSVLVSRRLRGVSRLIVPERSAEANAIGAAIAQVGGEADRIFLYSDVGRERALSIARAEACDKAIKAGGKPDTVKVIDVEEIPLGYGSGGAVRVRTKVVADLVMDA
ncbi:MAG TPA: hydantoinase/oxoprolinase family protein [Steroidobacter sp.]|uniref:hydantoinase/oxoprolinase family protein n=1 Tax=Steroidobacter sp. TaxID=1978227 RepID=UPI002ED8C421